MNSHLRHGIVVATGAAIAAVVALAGCTTDVASAPGTSTGTTTVAAPVSTTVATDAVLADQLRYLIEEEKLAHDVYVTLGEQWGGRIFTNIAAAEVTHQDAVARLLPAYGIADPRLAAVGAFTDPALQELHDRLVAEGSASPTAAYRVGVAIEEKDIADLSAYLATDPPADVAAVMTSLRDGSSNHLAAFQRQLA